MKLLKDPRIVITIQVETNFGEFLLEMDNLEVKRISSIVNSFITKNGSFEYHWNSETEAIQNLTNDQRLYLERIASETLLKEVPYK